MGEVKIIRTDTQIYLCILQSNQMIREIIGTLSGSLIVSPPLVDY